MTSSSTLSVSIFTAARGWEVSRYFQTVRAARNWAKWLRTQVYISEVAIHRGGPGGGAARLSRYINGRNQCD